MPKKPDNTAAPAAVDAENLPETAAEVAAPAAVDAENLPETAAEVAAPAAVDAENLPETAAEVAAPTAVDAENLPETAAEVAAPTHRIGAYAERGFYRAGRFWPRQGVEVAQAEFTAAKWSALEAEPALKIETL